MTFFILHETVTALIQLFNPNRGEARDRITLFIFENHEFIELGHSLIRQQ